MTVRKSAKLPAAQKLGLATRQENAAKRAANVLPVIREIQATGAVKLQEIADALNARGVPSARGGTWYPGTVLAVLKRGRALEGVRG